MNLRSSLVLTVAALVCLTGCKSVFWQDLTGSAATVTLEQAAVAAGVAAVVKGDPTRATVVSNTAKAILAIDTADTTTLATFEADLTAKIGALHLQPADAALAAALVAAIQVAINDQLAVSTKGIPPTVQVAIANVAKWVIADAGG